MTLSLICPTSCGSHIAAIDSLHSVISTDDAGVCKVDSFEDRKYAIYDKRFIALVVGLSGIPVPDDEGRQIMLIRGIEQTFSELPSGLPFDAVFENLFKIHHQFSKILQLPETNPYISDVLLVGYDQPGRAILRDSCATGPGCGKFIQYDPRMINHAGSGSEYLKGKLKHLVRLPPRIPNQSTRDYRKSVYLSVKEIFKQVYKIEESLPLSEQRVGPPTRIFEVSHNGIKPWKG